MTIWHYSWPIYLWNLIRLFTFIFHFWNFTFTKKCNILNNRNRRDDVMSRFHQTSLKCQVWRSAVHHNTLGIRLVNSASSLPRDIRPCKARIDPVPIHNTNTHIILFSKVKKELVACSGYFFTSLRRLIALRLLLSTPSSDISRINH